MRWPRGRGPPPPPPLLPLLLLLAAALPPRPAHTALTTTAPAPAPAPARPCASNALCVCRADHLACDSVPFYRFPDTEAGARHVAVSAARLGALGEAALDGRALRTLLLVASRLHRLHPAALSSMTSTLASLDLGYNEFTEIPIEALRELKVLNWLNLQNNLISELPPGGEWGALADTLSSLSLSNNHISVVRAGALTALRRLAQLDLDGNRLRQLDAAALPPALALLRLADNLLPRAPCAALRRLPRLRHLHLRNNVLGDPAPRDGDREPDPRPDPDGDRDRVCDASRIDSLDLSHNELGDAYEFQFPHGMQLKRLVLDLNDFTAVPSFVLDCGRLEKLSMSHNRLTRLSDAAVRALAGDLERLDLDHNELAALPASVRELARLKHLSLAYNRLRRAPELPPRLQSLSLAGNELAALPAGLRALAPATLLYLDLGYNLIAHVPPDAFGPWAGALDTLVLRGNRVAQLAAGAFPPLPLRELVLGFNDLYHVEAGVFANLTRLRVLELSTALLSGDVPAGAPLDALAWLGLDNNNIHYFSSDDMLNFPSLEYLNLDFNKIIEFPSEVRRANATYKLKELRLAYNYISKINSEFLSELGELQSVDLSYNRLHNVSERGFADLPNLVYLGLASNELRQLGDGAFSGLPRLEALELQENALRELSARHFADVSSDLVNFVVNVSYNRISSLAGGPPVPINVLDLSHNELESVSKNFFESLGPHARQIFLSHNKLNQIDSSGFGSLTNLSTLTLANNNITVMKRRAFAEMHSLQILDLSNNRIEQLAAEQFFNLRRLRHLRLDGNALRALPRDAFKNTLLEYLDLGDNRLALFPSSALAQVGFTLRRLELPRNRLEYLDAAMFHTTGFLHELNLARNALTVLADNTLAGLPRLRRLDLSHNAIKANFRELFHGAPRLRRLALAGAGLRAAPHLPLAELAELDLAGNRVAAYGETDVRHLANLRALDLSANAFTSVRPAMWAALPRLASLDISRNPIVRLPRGALEGLGRLRRLRMEHLRRLEAVEPRALRPLVALRSLALDSQAADGRALPLAALVAAAPHLEALALVVREPVLGAQLLGLRAAKLRALEVTGRRLERVEARAFSALGRQRALALRLAGTSVRALPAGLARPLAGVPHLALDFSDNELVAFDADILYPNLTGWSRFATKLVPGGVVLAGNPLRCGCAAAWAGAWLRRWAVEAGGGSRGAVAAARRSACAGAAGGLARALLQLRPDEAECHASALSSRAHSLALAFAALLAALLAAGGVA